MKRQRRTNGLHYAGSRRPVRDHKHVDGEGHMCPLYQPCRWCDLTPPPQVPALTRAEAEPAPCLYGIEPNEPGWSDVFTDMVPD
jgi:hypothetical protein